MPGNCRSSMESAFKQNQSASIGFVYYLNQNEHHVVAALKQDRRSKES